MGCQLASAPAAAGLAGDLSALGEDADRVVAVKPLPVPSCGGGVGRDMCVFVFDRPGVCVGPTSDRCAEVAAVGGHEPEPAGAGGEDLELPRVMSEVVALTQETAGYSGRCGRRGSNESGDGRAGAWCSGSPDARNDRADAPTTPGIAGR